jgi:hypothetical protein
MRVAPSLFHTPVHLVSYIAENGDMAYGHVVDDTNDDGVIILPDLKTKTITVSRRSASVTTLVNSATLADIPISVRVQSEVKPLSSAAAAQCTAVDFFTFAIPAGAPPVLYVRFSMLKSEFETETETQTEVEQLIAAVTGVVAASSLTLSGVATVEEIDIHNASTWCACAHFYSDSDSDPARAVVALRLSPSGLENVSRLAHMLAARGFVVSPPSSNASMRTDAAFSRVTSSVLKWIKDDDCVSELSAIVDQLPGLLHGSKRRDASSGNVNTAALGTLTGVMYDTTFNVQRLMLCWGMLAACASRTLPDDACITDVPEPLQSYIRLVREFEHMRECLTDVADAPAVDVVKTMTYNSAPKLSAAQSASALTLFYWAAVHDDDGTRAVPRSVARRALEMYIPFGHVILRKRAYRFTS